MTDKSTVPVRSVRRINLTLPIVQRNSYEIYPSIRGSASRQSSTIQSFRNERPLININDNNKQIANHQPMAIRSTNRFQHFPGPVLVNLFVDMPTIVSDSSTSITDTISNALIDSGYSKNTFRTLSTISRRSLVREDSQRSCSSSVDRDIYESVVSFEHPLADKSVNNKWTNTQNAKLTKTKVLHPRKFQKCMFPQNSVHLRAPNTSSLGNLTQNLLTASQERLHEKIEHLTKNYFPMIQQLRHGYPCAEIINNRIHLHREERRDYVPVLPRARVIRQR